MSTTKYLIDYKNGRAFCLGDRYYPLLFGVGEVTSPLTVKAIEADITENGKYGSPDLARKLWAFCEVAGWQVGLRFDNAEYEGGRWGADGFVEIGSVWEEDGVDPDPCWKQQAEKEQEALAALETKS